MITGIAMVLAGLPLGFYGAIKFNYGIMACGWALAGAGAVVLLSSAVSPW